MQSVVIQTVLVCMTDANHLPNHITRDRASGTGWEDCKDVQVSVDTLTSHTHTHTHTHRGVFAVAVLITRVKGNDQADRLVGKATITSGLCLERSEVLRILRYALQTPIQGHHTVMH